MKQHYNIVSEVYWSNCLVEVIRAKIKNPKIRIYTIWPRLDLKTRPIELHNMHFMWSDGEYDYDFSDLNEDVIPWYRTFWYKGTIRQFKLGFAEKWSKFANHRKGGRR